MSTLDYQGVAAPQTGQIEQDDFSGGWNLRDADSQVEDNETPDAINMTLDERGGAVKRLGLEATGALSGIAQRGFRWHSEDKIVVQVGDRLYVGGDLSSLSLIHTFSTPERIGMCDFLSKLVFVHPNDGVYVYTTGSGVIQSGQMNNVKGDVCAAWQNTVVVTGDKRNDNRSRVWRSALADPTVWDTSATGDWVDLREKDDAPLTAIATQGGEDVVGRPGLIVCKHASTYRINDPTNLGYTTLHAQAGASGPLAVTDLLGLTCMLNEDGIWATNGVDPPELVSGKISPLFRESQIDFDQLGDVSCGINHDRVLFSLPRKIDGSSPAANNFTLEFHPTLGWIMPHDFGLADYVSDPESERLIGLSPGVDKAFYVFKGGDDDGADIASRFQTKWFEPTRGIRNRFRRIRLKGRGQFDLFVRRDYTLGAGDLEAVDLSTGGFVWNAWHWNDGSVWGPSQYEAYVDVWSLGVGRAISFSFEETGSTSATSRKILGDGTAAEAGAFAVYGFLVDFIELGNA